MPKIEMTFKELKSCDVLVAGGGSAGCASAISAARAGAKTVLIEKATFLGGMATGGLVTPMMRNALDIKHILTKGIFLEICNRLLKAGSGATFQDGNPGWFNPEIYKIVLDEMCTESGVKLMFDNQIIHADVGIRRGKPIIEKIFIVNKGGCFSIQAKEYIDATGDGDLIAISGASYESGTGGQKQAMSLRFMMSGVNLLELADWLQKNDKSIDSPVYFLENGDILLSTACTFEKDWALKPFFEEALKKGDLQKEDAAYFQIFSVPGSPGFVAFNCPRITMDSDPLNNDDVSFALIQGRQMIKRISNFCKKYLPGFKSAYVSQIAPLLGVRESRRLIGQYILTREDILSGKKFEDAILDSNWPIDIHPVSNQQSAVSSRKGQIQRPKDGDYYQIPLRSLLPKENEIKNLIVAGRCLSATFEAQASARIQANCISMGEAAGLLVAKRIKETSKEKIF